MKKITLLLTLTFSVILIFGQHGEGSSETIKLWKEKTLIVIQYPNSDFYNEAVKTVSKKRWYSDKIEFVEYANIDKIKKRKDAVVLNIKNWFNYINMPIICFTKPNKPFFFNKTGWAYINIQNDHELGANYKEWQSDYKKDKTKIVKTTSIAYGLEKIRNSSLERTTLMIELLFNTTDQFKDKEYRYKNSKKDNGFYNISDNINMVKTKTLLIEEKSLPRTKKNKKLLQLTHLQSIYKGKIKIVSEKELQEAIKNNDKNSLYLHVKEEVSFPTYAIVNLSNKKIIYCGQERTKPGDSSIPKIFERMLINISNSIF
jgi:hypothetical protein